MTAYRLGPRKSPRQREYEEQPCFPIQATANTPCPRRDPEDPLGLGHCRAQTPPRHPRALSRQGSAPIGPGLVPQRRRGRSGASPCRSRTCTPGRARAGLLPWLSWQRPRSPPHVREITRLQPTPCRRVLSVVGDRPSLLATRTSYPGQPWFVAVTCGTEAVLEG